MSEFRCEHGFYGDGCEQCQNFETLSSHAVLGEVATVKETSVGPNLYIGKLKVRSWFGTSYNNEAHLLCEQINTELKVRSNLA